MVNLHNAPTSNDSAMFKINNLFYISNLYNNKCNIFLSGEKINYKYLKFVNYCLCLSHHASRS